MEISVDRLVQIIGMKQVEIEELRAENRRLREAYEMQQQLLAKQKGSEQDGKVQE